ncbi:hypothetical protein R0K19_23315, partial [Bacillus sp. SIMBA_161]
QGKSHRLHLPKRKGQAATVGQFAPGNREEGRQEKLDRSCLGKCKVFCLDRSIPLHFFQELRGLKPD